MKPGMLLLTLLTLLSTTTMVSGGELQEKLLGKWRYKGKQAGATIESLAEFQENGAYQCRMNVGLFGTSSVITFKGKWRIEDDVHVVIEVIETSSSILLPKGKIMRKEGVTIKEGVMSYRYNGKPEEEKRVEEKEGEAG